MMYHNPKFTCNKLQIRIRHALCSSPCAAQLLEIAFVLAASFDQRPPVDVLGAESPAPPRLFVLGAVGVGHLGGPEHPGLPSREQCKQIAVQDRVVAGNGMANGNNNGKK
jgi:hypothetical protein